MYIYQIKNIINDKKYVGKTKRDILTRWLEHVSASKDNKDEQTFYYALQKYGIESFEIIILQDCRIENTIDFLNEREKYWIKTLNSKVPNGYNMTDGGDGGSEPGRVVSEETREKIKIIARERYFNGHGELMRSKRKTGEDHFYYGVTWGRTGPLTQEHKDNISKAHEGKTLTQEHKDNISIGCTGKEGPNLGKSWSVETHQKNAINRYFRKKPVFGFNEEGICVIMYLSVEDAMIATGLGYRILMGNRKKYKPKYTNGITYLRSDLTIRELKEKDNGISR